MRIFSTLLLLIMSTNIFAQVEVRQVSIASNDRFQLQAKYYFGATGGPGILLLHQCDREGPLTGYEKLAGKLAGAGFNVLVPDRRGYGESRDEHYRDFHSQMSLIEPTVAGDMEAIFGFLSSQSEIDKTRIGVTGASCGVRHAIRLAANHPEIRAMVFVSGAYNPKGRLADDYVKLANIPVLSMYSERDRYGTPAAMRHAFENSNNEYSKLLVYKGNKHGTPLFEQDVNLENEISMWLVTNLQEK